MVLTNKQRFGSVFASHLRKKKVWKETLGLHPTYRDVQSGEIFSGLAYENEVYDNVANKVLRSSSNRYIHPIIESKSVMESLEVLVKDGIDEASALYHRCLDVIDEFEVQRAGSRNASVGRSRSVRPDEVGSCPLVANETLRRSNTKRCASSCAPSGRPCDAPEDVGSGPSVSTDAANWKAAFIDHCNNDVYARPRKSKRHGVGVRAIRDFEGGEELFKVIPEVCATDTVVLTRMDIETKIYNDQVKKLIYDLFPPARHIDDPMLDAFSLPAKGLNHLPYHYFMNADRSSHGNVHASDVRDEMGYVAPVSSQSGRRGDELLWPSNALKITSAADYRFFTASSRSAAYTVNDNDEKELLAELEMLREENRKLKEKKRAQLLSKMKRWRPLSADGGDVGKHGQAYFNQDKQWVDVFIKSFKKRRGKMGQYKFEFVLLDAEGNPRREGGEAVEEIEDDVVSACDESVMVPCYFEAGS